MRSDLLEIPEPDGVGLNSYRLSPAPLPHALRSEGVAPAVLEHRGVIHCSLARPQNCSHNAYSSFHRMPLLNASEKAAPEARPLGRVPGTEPSDDSEFAIEPRHRYTPLAFFSTGWSRL